MPKTKVTYGTSYPDGEKVKIITPVQKPSMNIFKARPGTKVRYSFPQAGYPDDEKQSRRVLTEGRIYTVAEMSITGFSSRVMLSEHTAYWFNTVHFTDV